VIALLLFACASDPAPPNPAAGAGEGAPVVPTMLGDAPGIKFTDMDWTSASCDSRKYARNLRIESDNTYAGVDLVSPCPEGTQCVWSGLVGFAGIWKQEDRKLLLREIGGPIAQGSPHPTEIISTVDGTLVENGCTYVHGLTVPPGYTEDRVRPKVPGK
jgi:hypothetical protein